MKRYFMAFIGVVLIGFSVAVLNLSGFGVDPFSCMNMSVSAHLPFSFGVWQIFVNAVILMLLIIHVIKEKKKIGAVFGFGTLWNMTGVGLKKPKKSFSERYFRKYRSSNFCWNLYVCDVTIKIIVI